MVGIGVNCKRCQVLTPLKSGDACTLYRPVVSSLLQQLREL